MDEAAKHYLDYLEKEMGIMGVLSTFSLAVPSLLIERMLSVDPKSLLFPIVTRLLASGALFIVLSVVLMLLAAMFFYKQRSQLAWYYGQVALELAIPNYTAQRVNEWLKDADSWAAWAPYFFAFWLWCGAIAAILLAGLSQYFSFLSVNAMPTTVVFTGILLLWLMWVKRTLEKFKCSEDINYFKLR